VLFVIDPEARHVLEPSAIVDLLGLTPAEARVVAALAMGTALAEAATRLGVTVNTARTCFLGPCQDRHQNHKSGLSVWSSPP
jgi:hypothetical protein